MKCNANLLFRAYDPTTFIIDTMIGSILFCGIGYFAVTSNDILWMQHKWSKLASIYTLGQLFIFWRLFAAITMLSFDIQFYDSYFLVRNVFFNTRTFKYEDIKYIKTLRNGLSLIGVKAYGIVPLRGATRDARNNIVAIIEFLKTKTQVSVRS